MNSPAPAVPGRIAVLGALVIDQIAAGEVVERPASVVKELVDNSLDAGSTRIDVELEDGGLARISVRDNGRGIHPDDLLLAVTRHATSKLRHAADIADISTLGFRGEALASVAAVARVDLRSRQPGAAVGVHLHGIPGEAPLLTPAGMPVGTQIEVHALFANLPARRKFMRAEATEVGHCSDTLLRLAIVHPGVHFTLRHGKRELLNLPRATREVRVAQVLERRVAGPFFAFQGEDDGVRVECFLPHPTAAARGRGSPYLITRQRVVRERSLAQILTQAYGLGGEAPSACLFVEPPAGAVDVNVHPQKAEVRFSEPQQVYAAVRRILAAAVAAAPWASELAAAAAAGPGPSNLSVAPASSTTTTRPSGHGVSDLSSAPASPGAVTGPSGHGASDRSSVPASPPGSSATREPDPARGTAASVPPGRGGAIPIGFAPVRMTEGARDDDDDAPPDRRRASESQPAPGRRRPPPDDDEAPDTEHDLDDPAASASGPDDPGSARRRLERAAAAAAAGRRAEAEAWLTRAEASVDAGRHPLVESDRTPPPSAPTAARPARIPFPAAPDTRASDPAWDLDLADADAREHAEAVPEDMSSPSARDLAPETADTDLSPETATWLTRAGVAEDVPAPARDRAVAWVERAGGELPPDLHASADPLLRWSELQPAAPEPPRPPPSPGEARPGAYRLSTRALDQGYDRHKRSVMEAAAALRPDGAAPRPAEPERDDTVALLPIDIPGPRDMREPTGPGGQAVAPPRADVPALLACLPGPVAVFGDRDALLAVDLRRVRSYLVYLRLQRDLVGRRAVAVQGLLSPAVVQRSAADVALIQAARGELLGLGVDLDVFGDDAVVVRGVPAHLRHCVDDADAADLVARIVPWLRIRSGDGDRAARERGLLDAIATTSGGDPAPRLARRWLAELIDAGAALESVPGIRRWSANALLGGA